MHLLRLSCSLYIPLLPLIFVLGTATSQSVLHSMLPVTLRAKIAVESFQLQRGLSTFESLMRGVSDNKISWRSFDFSLFSFFWTKSLIWASCSRAPAMTSSRTATRNTNNLLIHFKLLCRRVYVLRFEDISMNGCLASLYLRIIFQFQPPSFVTAICLVRRTRR